jgi:hypothetical protein
MKLPSGFVILGVLALSCGTLFARGGGGCIEEGTPVLTPAGPVAVERLAPGDPVLTVVAGGTAPATVEALVRVECEEYVELSASMRVLRVTAEHPVAVAEYFGRVVAACIIGVSIVVAAAVIGGIIAALY